MIFRSQTKDGRFLPILTHIKKIFRKISDWMVMIVISPQLGGEEKTNKQVKNDMGRPLYVS
jgi:hypothetical protein